MRQNRTEEALVIADSSRGRVLAERHGVAVGRRTNAAALRQAARRSGRTLLSYWVTPAQSYVWVVTPQSVRTATLPGAGEIERLVREHRSNMESSLLDLLTAAPGTAADRLFDTLVAPIRQWLPEDGALIIVPDGPLHALNFETLTTSDPSGRRRYWIEDFEIQIAPSLVILGAQELSSAQPAARAVSTVRGERTPSLLLVGNSEPQGGEFPALRYAPIEMAGISAHFAPEAVAVYQGAEAVPAAYREARPERFSMIHFTAHATANVDSPLDSAVILSGPPDRFRLTARDVAEQKLNAELVTVSACRSAGERAYSGEGLIGFAWAFLRAGSKRVVAGLWDVDDRSTATLMNSFYARLADGVRPAQALREAKLELIRSGVTKPYYWAPLQMFTVVPQ
jgi:CHAT domain-containing protein